MRVAIQVPAYKEGESMSRTLGSIRSQRVPRGVDVRYEAWVTPADGDETWAVAQRAPGWDVYEAPRGKLSARNEAHTSAFHDRYDVVVSWDADAPALHDDVLSNLLSPYGRGAVATNGWYTHSGPSKGIEDALAKIDFTVFRPIYGRLSSISAHGWSHAGPFDEDVDQQSLNDIRREEEFAFRRRLEAAGEVADVKEAVVHGDSRRYRCMMDKVLPWRDPDQWCLDRGGMAFAPEGRP